MFNSSSARLIVSVYRRQGHPHVTVTVVGDGLHIDIPAGTVEYLTQLSWRRI